MQGWGLSFIGSHLKRLFRNLLATVCDDGAVKHLRLLVINALNLFRVNTFLNFEDWLMRAILLTTLAFSAAVCSAQTIYKCPDANGRLAMQDTPCLGGSSVNVKPASGADGTAPASTSKTAVSIVERRSLKSDVEQMAKERRIRELDFEIAHRNSRIGGVQADSQRRIALLRQDGLRANNNLAGATWQQSLASEMQAIATDTQNKISTLQSEITGLEKELAALKSDDKGTAAR